ncbi:MAG: hypothetical protein ACLP8X_09135 [Streptosporangiaceae bacterium]
MKALLAIAESFLDRMTNPLYGTEVNEEYSLRFNQLLAEDPAFAASFAELALEPDDVDSLPACAWPWYLQWRCERADPPPAEFLDALFEATDDPAIQMAVMISALSDSGRADVSDGEPVPYRDDDSDSYTDVHPDTSPRRRTEPGDEATGTAPYSRESLPELGGRRNIRSRWLRTRIDRLAYDPQRAPSVAGAIEVATYLLQLGDPESLTSLQELLAAQWSGQEELRQAIDEQLEEADLDPETAARWRSELGLFRQA